MPHCLITGATGFIGPHLVRELIEAGGDVTCLVRTTSNTSQLESLGVHVAPGDVTEPSSLAPALDGVDFVFHLAGRTFANSQTELNAVNEAGTANLAACCASQSDPPVLVVVSSVAAAGPSPVGGVLQETDTPSPISNYGRSKLAGELAAGNWAAEVPISIVRPPVVFGPGDRAGLILVKSLLKSGVHFVHRPGLPLSLVHARDLASILLLVARHGERLDPTHPGGTGIYYAADPQVSSYREMGQIIADALPKKIRVIKVRKWALALAASAGEVQSRLSGKPSVLNWDKLREATATGWAVSTDKIRSQFGFKPSATLAEHYQATIDWYREEGWI